ncbi:MAG: 4-hydroxy-tetrahydrodipicolinate reductase [Candidatus Omnitrophica bacterium]|nr:4-hydroxy-tetrahydrodipicolinate reductase [Candidatus Omnitrophota bacterium]
MIKLGICGICGKMGRMIAKIAFLDDELKVAAGFEVEGHPDTGKDIGEILGIGEAGVAVSSDVKEGVKGIDVLIDFTSPGSSVMNADICMLNGKAIVIGTTGLSEDGEKAIKKYSKKIPIIYSPNMAPGVNLLFDIAAKCAKALGEDFDIKVDETHHIHKKDSPSGTAKMIAKRIKEACGRDVPIEAKRVGEVVGNHGIIFKGQFETIEIRHDAKSREVFAAGAVKAAKFLAGRKPGLYGMGEVLGL